VESTDTERERDEVDQVLTVSCPHVGKAVHLASIKKSLKVAWVRVGQCAVCFKEQQTKSSSCATQHKRVKNEVLRREFGGKLSAQEIKRLQLERAKAERLAAAEKLKKIKETTDNLKISNLEAITNEEKEEDAPADDAGEAKEKKTDDEAVAVAGPQSCWLCMRCGSQGCGNNMKKHSYGHYKVPRSDLHCLIVNTHNWTIWCYECQTEISVDTHKKLYEVVELVRRTRDQPVSSSKTMSGVAGGPSLVYSSPSAAAGGKTSAGKVGSKGSQSLLPRVKGLNNLGNTCFFNSVLQCLAQTKPLTQLIDEQTSSGVSFSISGSCVQSQEESECSDTTGGSLRLLDVYSDISVKLAPAGPLFTSLAGFFREMVGAANSKANVLSPGQVFSQVVRLCNKFRGMQQQDSHELLRYLMDGLRTEESKRQKSAILKYFGLTEKSDPKNVPAHLRKKLHGYGRESGHTLLDKIFSGQLVSSIVCEECHHSTQNYEQFLDLSLPVLEERPAKPAKKVSVMASDEDNTKGNRRNKNKAQKKKDRQKKEKRSKALSRKNSRAETDREEREEGEQKIREELQGTEEFEKVKMVEKQGVTASKKFGRQLSTGSWKDKNAEEEEGYEEDEDEASADWEWDYGDPWEEKQHIVFRSKARSEENLAAPVQLLSVKFLSEGDVHVQQREKSLSRSPSNVSSISVNSEDSEEGSGASSDGDIEDNDNEEDQRWVMSKNLINNLSKLDSLLNTSGNLEPRLAPLCDSMSNLRLEAGSSLTPRKRMTAEWTARSLASLAPRYQAQPGECSVYTCLNNFTQSELLTGSNKWGCESCTEQRKQDNSDTSNTEEKKATVYSPASKQLLIFCPPAILTLHLKRFQQTLSGCKKLNKHVSFPLELDLAPFCSATCLAMPSVLINNKSINYSLYGVVEHSGGLTGGHYTACVKVRSDLQDYQQFFSPSLSKPGDIPKFLQEMQNKVKNTRIINDLEEDAEQVKPNVGEKKWFLVSDSHVSEISEDRVLKSQAYLLFYERIL